MIFQKLTQHSLLGKFRVFLQKCWTSLESSFHDFRKTQRGRLGSSTQLPRTLDQHMHTMGANHTHHHGTEQPNHPSSVSEGVRHRQDASPDIAFQQVHHSIKITCRVLNVSVTNRIIIRYGIVHIHYSIVAKVFGFQETLFLLASGWFWHFLYCRHVLLKTINLKVDKQFRSPYFFLSITFEMPIID